MTKSTVASSQNDVDADTATKWKNNRRKIVIGTVTIASLIAVVLTMRYRKEEESNDLRILYACFWSTLIADNNNSNQKKCGPFFCQTGRFSLSKYCCCAGGSKGKEIKNTRRRRRFWREKEYPAQSRRSRRALNCGQRRRLDRRDQSA